jgi:hypothetical protein
MHRLLRLLLTRAPAAAFSGWLLAAGAFAAPAKQLPAPVPAPTPPAPATTPLRPFAEQIDATNFARVAVRGNHAIGGIGDWAIGNGVLCATVSNPEHETYLSTRGGVLIDLGHCDRADDMWNAAHPLFNMSKDQVMSFNTVRAESDAGSASLIAEGSSHGVAIRMVYRLDQQNPDELRVETTLVRKKADSTRLFLFGLLGLHPNRTLTPFSLSLSKPEYNLGFVHPPLDTDSIRSVISAMQPSEWQMLVGSPNTAPVSYGWGIVGAEHIDANGNRSPLPLFAFNSQDVTMFGVFSAPLSYAREKPGLLEFAQTPWLDLGVSETLHIQQRILLGARADVASLTDRLYAGNWLQGRLDKPRSVALHIDTEDGTPLTMVQPDADGTFAARLPAGVDAVQLRMAGDGFAPIVRRFAVAQPRTDIGTLTIPLPGIVVLPRGAPVKLIFKGTDGTPDPLLFDDGRGFSVGDKPFYNAHAHNSVSLAGINADRRYVVLAPGHYRVLATRGPFHTVTETSLDAQAGVAQYLGIEQPQRAVDTAGWISADFHVHSGYSFDSDLDPQQRIEEFIAQDAQVMVPSEHNFAVDYQPWLEKLGLRRKIVAIGGSELTGIAHGPDAPKTMGHANVFPLLAKPDEFLGGTLPHEDRALGDVIGAYKKYHPQLFFQLNHPRTTDRDADMAYLNHLSGGDSSFDPQQLLGHRRNSTLLKRRLNGYRDIDFDGMELLNGSALDAYELVRADWFSLLRQGFIKVATANSDSHAVADLVALPRNMVRFDAPDLAAFDTTGFIAAVKAGMLVGSTGPLLDMKLNDIGIGGVLRGNSGTLTVKVDAAPWVDVNTLDIYVNGKRWQSVEIRAGDTHTVPMKFTAPSFVTAEVRGTPGDIYRIVAPGFTPMAFTNPIFVLPE